MSTIPKFLVPLTCAIFLFLQPLQCQQSNAVVIKHTTVCEASRDRVTTTETVVLQINDRSGDRYAEISIPWSKDEKLTHLEGWIETLEGKKIRDLKKSQVTDRSAISESSLYEDDYERYFELKHNVYPYLVTYSYTIVRQNFITYTWWSPMVFSTVPTLYASLEVTIPAGIQYRQYSIHMAAPRVDSNATRTRLLWESYLVKPLQHEIYSQGEEAESIVMVAPLMFVYGVEGSLKDWQSFGNWQYRLMDGLDELPDWEKMSITALIRGISDKKEIVRVLYHYLQDHTRYINVTIGIGGLKPYPASYVAKNKFGDCKALTNYMKALLKFAGIESFYVTVYSSEQPREPLEGFAGPFNHVILAVKIGPDTLWLENTSNINPFGYVGTSIQNRKALLVVNQESRLVQTPALKRDDNLVINRLTYNLNLNGNARLLVNSSFRGNKFELFNQFHSQLNVADKERRIRDYMPYENCEVLTWELNKAHRDTTLITLNATLTMHKILQPLGNEYYFSIHPCEVPPFTVPANRSLSVILPYPLYNIDSLEYNLPAGFTMKKDADTVRLLSSYGNYELTTQSAPGKIIVLRKFELYAGTYSTGKYPDFYHFIRSVKEADAQKLVIKPVN